ncbi:hypothetical protein CFI11_09130 [Thalassococcus sp. S3]|nr:hypothetical protein CFI11_09130 [Thalassococcus sp. S3]
MLAHLAKFGLVAGLALASQTALACPISEKTFRYRDAGLSGQVGFSKDCDYVIIRQAGEQYFAPLEQRGDGWEARRGPFAVHFSQDMQWMRFETQELRHRVRLIPTN